MWARRCSSSRSRIDGEDKGGGVEEVEFEGGTRVVGGGGGGVGQPW